METPKVPLSVWAVHCASCLLSLWEMRALASFQTSSWLASSVISCVSLSLDNAVCVWVYFSHWYVSAQLCASIWGGTRTTHRWLFSDQTLVCGGSELIIATWYPGGAWLSIKCLRTVSEADNAYKFFSLSTVSMVASIYIISQGFKWRRQSSFLTPAQVQAFIFWMLQQERCTLEMEIGAELFQIDDCLKPLSSLSSVSSLECHWCCIPLDADSCHVFFSYHFLFSIFSYSGWT